MILSAPPPPPRRCARPPATRVRVNAWRASKTRNAPPPTPSNVTRSRTSVSSALQTPTARAEHAAPPSTNASSAWVIQIAVAPHLCVTHLQTPAAHVEPTRNAEAPRLTAPPPERAQGPAYSAPPTMTAPPARPSVTATPTHAGPVLPAPWTARATLLHARQRAPAQAAACNAPLPTMRPARVPPACARALRMSAWDA